MGGRIWIADSVGWLGFIRPENSGSLRTSMTPRFFPLFRLIFPFALLNITERLVWRLRAQVCALVGAFILIKPSYFTYRPLITISGCSEKVCPLFSSLICADDALRFAFIIELRSVHCSRVSHKGRRWESGDGWKKSTVMRNNPAFGASSGRRLTMCDRSAPGLRRRETRGSVERDRIRFGTCPALFTSDPGSSIFTFARLIPRSSLDRQHRTYEQLPSFLLELTAEFGPKENRDNCV